MWYIELENGKRQYREDYIDPITGKKKRATITVSARTPQKTAKKALEAKIEEKIANNTPLSQKCGLRLLDIVSAYRDDQKNTVTASTYTRNYFACDRIMNVLGKDTLITSIDAGYVRKKCNEKDMEAGTYNEWLTRFKALFRWAYRNDIIEDIRFLDKLQKRTNKEKQEKLSVKFLENDELNTLLKAMTQEKWLLVTMLGALSGMRIGEIFALTYNDLDFEQEYIHVTKTYDAVNKVVTSPKTENSVRDVHMQKELYDLCRRIVLFSKREQLKYKYRSDLVFSDVNGEHVNYYCYCTYLKENAEKVLGRKVTPHYLRHTHVAIMAENGASLAAIARRLGHKSSKTTEQIYYHVTSTQKQKDNSEFDGIKILDVI